MQSIESENSHILAVTISRERNMFVAEIHIRSCQRVRKTVSFHRWWHMVPYDLKVPEVKTPSSFLFLPEKRKTSLKELCNISRTELRNVLMTTFHVDYRTVN
ncbi:MAG: hypothetical protein AB7V56_04895 [Candidatus Nitrosocosmicus sp.]